MKKWLIEALADEKKYYIIFLSLLSVFALVMTAISYFLSESHPHLSFLMAIFSLAGGCIIGFVMRTVHNLCYAKVNGNKII